MSGQSPSVSPWLLSLISDNEAIQHLIVTWPGVHADVVVAKGQKLSRDNGELVAEWARRCSLRPEEVRHVWDKLFANGLVNVNGTADAVACKFIASVALSAIKKKGSK